MAVHRPAVSTVRMSRLTIPKDKNFTKAENMANAVEEEEVRIGTLGSASPGPGQAVGYATWGHQFTLSRRFQSVKTECSISLPVLVNLSGNVPAQMEAAAKVARDLSENLISNSIHEQNAALSELIGLADR